MTDLRLFTSESVTEGHPDKICDQISDSILDAILEADPHGRVAVETLVTTGLVHVAGEVSTSAYVEIPAIVRRVVNRIGYTSSDTGFDGDSCGVSVSIGQQGWRRVPQASRHVLPATDHHPVARSHWGCRVDSMCDSEPRSKSSEGLFRSFSVEF